MFLLFCDMTTDLRSGPHHDAIDRFIAVDHLDNVLVSPRRQQRGFVEQVLEIGAGETRRSFGERFERNFAAQRFVASVNFENLLSALEVGATDDDLTVEAPRTQERRVEDVGPVRSGD